MSSVKYKLPFTVMKAANEIAFVPIPAPTFLSLPPALERAMRATQNARRLNQDVSEELGKFKVFQYAFSAYLENVDLKPYVEAVKWHGFRFPIDELKTIAENLACLLLDTSELLRLKNGIPTILFEETSIKRAIVVLTEGKYTTWTS